MRAIKPTLFTTLLLVGASVIPVEAQIHRTSDTIRRADLAREAQLDDMLLVPMRDGKKLATKVYMPKDQEGPVPAIFWRTPYNTSALAGSNPNRPSALLKYALDAVRRGYAFVVQNERGKFFSEGEWEILGRPRTDGYDALSWIAEQPWSNGKVATLGCSSTAEWQMGLAAMNHPAHAAAIPMGQGAGIGRVGPFYEHGNVYRGGALNLPMLTWLYGEQNLHLPDLPAGLSRDELLRQATYFDLAPKMPSVDWTKALWHLPVSDIMRNAGGPEGIYSDFIRRKPDDPAWYEGGLYHDNEGFGVPALWVNSWYDLSVGPNLALYQHARAKADADVRDHQFMIVAPTLHCAMYRLTDPVVVGERNMGSFDEVAFGFDDIVFDFLDQYTKPAASRANSTPFIEEQPRVRYFAMGKNEWRTSPDWPPQSTTQTLYLNSETSANSLFGDGALTASTASRSSSDTFTYDPQVPAPTKGGNFCCLGSYPPGSFDQREVEARQDVLVYTTEAFTRPLDVAGSIEVVLYVSSDAKDTDFTVKLLDVAPDGRAFNLDDSILRMRYREGFDRHVFMETDEVYEVRIGPLATANVFDVGHSLRVEVSSSNFPRYDRNLNTGGDNLTETKSVTARNTVHHGQKYPSRIVLPVLE